MHKSMTHCLSSFSSKTKTIAGLMLAFASVGCSSTSGPASASFASAVIHHRSPAEIHATTGKVFREDGYAGVQTGPMQMLFQKEASRMASISRDGLVATQAGARTMERVRTELVDLGGGSYRLQCEAFMVSGAGDAFFENEVRKTNLRSGPYRSLLKKVAKELK
jgi:hypothetical protein